MSRLRREIEQLDADIDSAESARAVETKARRCAFLPCAVRDLPPSQTPEGTDLEVWTYEASDSGRTGYFAIGFAGAARKPLFHHSYKSAERRQESIDEYAEMRRSKIGLRVAARAERTAFRHTVKVGDIFVSSWGYDQTNVDFYEVTDVLDGMVEVRKVAQRAGGESRSGTDLVVAAPGEYAGPPMRKRVGPGNTIKVGDHHASLWDGKPQYQTAFGWGH